MKTSHRILKVLQHQGHLSVGQIARLLPGLTLHQVQCSLTRLVDAGRVGYELGGNSAFTGNHKQVRHYYLSQKR